jgi:hypothetical protein
MADGRKLEDLLDNITLEEFCAAMAIWNERTTASPSGRHLGHYKILLRLLIAHEVNPHLNICTKILEV